MKSFLTFINEQLINEHFVNLLYNKVEDIKKMREYAKEAWDIIEPAYEYCGGVAGCPDFDSFVKYYVDKAESEKLFWKLVTRNGKITCIRIYTLKRYGRKGILIACANTEQGKKDLNMLLHEDYSIESRNCWNETSGKAFSTSLHYDPMVLPAHVIKALMPDKNDIELMPDGYFYKRTIGGKIHIKCVLGYAKHSDEIGIKPTEEFKEYLKQLAIKYSEEEKLLNEKEESD